MESLDQLRNVIKKLQNDVDLLEKTASDIQSYEKVVGVKELSEVSQQLLKAQRLPLLAYLGHNFSNISISAQIDTTELILDYAEHALSGEPNLIDTVFIPGLAIASGREMRPYYVDLPPWKILRPINRILNDDRDQQVWASLLQAELKILRELIKVDPKGVSELIGEVGRLLCDQLGEFTAPVDEFLEGVVLIVAKILGQILKWTREVGGDIVQWVKDNWAEVEKFLAELADFVTELLPQIAGFIEQNAGSVVVVMGAVLVVVMNVRQKSRFRLEDLEMSEND